MHEEIELTPVEKQLARALKIRTPDGRTLSADESEEIYEMHKNNRPEAKHILGICNNIGLIRVELERQNRIINIMFLLVVGVFSMLFIPLLERFF